MKNFVVSDPKIMMGKPVIVGTRITVELILEKLAAGETFDDLIDSHPGLSKGAILSALKFASKALKGDIVHPLKKRNG